MTATQADAPSPGDGAGRSAHGLWIFWPLLVLTVALMVVLQAVDRPLRTAAAPLGIVSYEFGGTMAGSQAILDSWSGSAREHAGFSLGLDYLYMPAYALTIALACVWAGRKLGGRWRGWRIVGWVAAGGLGVAALLDATENVALTRMLFGGVADPWPAVARWCATGKFALIIAGLLFALAGLIYWLVVRLKAKP